MKAPMGVALAGAAALALVLSGCSGSSDGGGADPDEDIVLNFWGSWCAPCRKEAPTLAVLSEKYQSKGVRFVGIDIRDPKEGRKALVDINTMADYIEKNRTK